MKIHPRAILFSGILFADHDYQERAIDALVSKFGPPRLVTPPVPWHSEHYSLELGAPIMRQFVFFRNLVPQDALEGIKNLTRSIESVLSVGGMRRVNLDPGLLAPARVVLATTKDYAHRIYLGNGIYAEATLIYRGGRFIPGEFAYSDYTGEEVLRMFARMRAELMQDLSNGCE